MAHLPDKAAVPMDELGMVLQEQGGRGRSCEEHRPGGILSFWKEQWQSLIKTQISKLHGGICAELIRDFSICTQHQWYFLEPMWATGLCYCFPLSCLTRSLKSLVPFMYLRKESHTNGSEPCKRKKKIQMPVVFKCAFWGIFLMFPH